MNDSGWQVPKHRVIELSPKRHNYALCITLINEGPRIISQLEKLKKFNHPVDIILCDGGSTDGSNDPEMGRKFGVRAILIKEGPGKMAAQMRMGYAYALKQDYRGVIDVNGNDKDGMDGVPRFIEKLDEGYDFIQGSRWIEGGKEFNTPPLRKWAIKIIHSPSMRLISGFPYTDNTNGFRGLSRKFLLDPRVQPFRDMFMKYELLMYTAARAARLGFKVCEVPVTRGYPPGKVPTKINFKAYFEMIADLVRLAFGYYNPR